MSGQRKWILVAANLCCLPVNLYFVINGQSTGLRVLGLFAGAACVFTVWRYLRDHQSFE